MLGSQKGARGFTFLCRTASSQIISILPTLTHQASPESLVMTLCELFHKQDHSHINTRQFLKTNPPGISGSRRGT